MKLLVTCCIVMVSFLPSRAVCENSQSEKENNAYILTSPPLSRQQIILHVNLDSMQVTKFATLPSGWLAFPPILNGNFLYGTLFKSDSLNKISSQIYMLDTKTARFIPAYRFGQLNHEMENKDGTASEASLLVGRLQQHLYGTCMIGGMNGGGTIFRFNVMTHKLRVLHAFAGHDKVLKRKYGAYPTDGRLCRIGSQLYGTTAFGGRYGKGVIYTVTTDGSAYRVLHSFSSKQIFQSDIVYSGGLLIGDIAVRPRYKYFLFSMKLNGAGFHLVHSLSELGIPTMLFPSENTNTIILLNQAFKRGYSIIAYNTTTDKIIINHRFKRGEMLEGAVSRSNQDVLGVCYVHPLSSGFVYRLDHDNFTILANFIMKKGLMQIQGLNSKQ